MGRRGGEGTLRTAFLEVPQSTPDAAHSLLEELRLKAGGGTFEVISYAVMLASSFLFEKAAGVVDHTDAILTLASD
jgi:hypothetical protein